SGERTLDLQLDARANAGCGKVVTATTSGARFERDLIRKRCRGRLAASNCAGRTPPEPVRRSWERAGIVAGLSAGDELIGCGRVVTDFARVVYLSDDSIVAERRGELVCADDARSSRDRRRALAAPHR
ncbi:MAG TPA: hypothetical protein VFQ80_03330, partial [Thermomicrobiales bacterium]|nr:hypothetical protein [Thermomicrobiales bacterium]